MSCPWKFRPFTDAIGKLLVTQPAENLPYMDTGGRGWHPPGARQGCSAPGESENPTATARGRKKNWYRKNALSANIHKFTLPFWTRQPSRDPAHIPCGSERAHVWFTLQYNIHLRPWAESHPEGRGSESSRQNGGRVTENHDRTTGERLGSKPQGKINLSFHNFRSKSVII